MRAGWGKRKIGNKRKQGKKKRGGKREEYMYTTDIYILVFIQKEHLMHLNSKTGKEGEEQGTKKAKRGGSEDEDELGKPSKKIIFWCLISVYYYCMCGWL